MAMAYYSSNGCSVFIKKLFGLQLTKGGTAAPPSTQTTHAGIHGREWSLNVVKPLWIRQETFMVWTSPTFWWMGRGGSPRTAASISHGEAASIGLGEAASVRLGHNGHTAH